MDLLISKGVRCSVHAALTLVGSHYDGTDYDVVGQGYASRRSDNEIIAIGNFAARSAKVLTSKVLAASSICIQYQAPGA